MINQKQLLKTIIKQTILTERFLTEAPIDVWKNKNKSLTQQQISQAEKYFADLTGKLNALLHPTTKDLTSFSFDQLETLFKAIEIAREKNLKTPYVQWLTKQLKQKNLNLQQIIEDYIPPLFSLQKNKNKFEPDVLDKLESIEQLNQQLNATISSTEMAVSDAELGKLAEEDGWVLYMPHTTEASCEIGKTGGRRDTTWCTTRPDASNMFLQYVAQADANVVLFYVVKKGVNAEKDPYAKMSVGIIHGKPNFDQGDGGVSVNANNDNLTKNKFEEVVGKDLADKFLRIMQEKSTSLGGEHPAKEEFRKLVQNPVAFKAKLDSFDKDENGQYLREDFIETALKYEGVSDAVYDILISDENEKTKILVAKNIFTPEEILIRLTTDPNIRVRDALLYNKKISARVLEILVRKEEGYFLYRIANSHRTPPEILAMLATNSDRGIRKAVASNENTSLEILKKLSKDPYLSANVALNPSTPRDLLIELAENENVDTRRGIAYNNNTPPEALEILAKDPDEQIRKGIAQNVSTSPETLDFLAKHPDSDDSIKYTIIQNPNTSIKTLEHLITDRSAYTRSLARQVLKRKGLMEAIIMEKVLWKLLKRID